MPDVLTLEAPPRVDRLGAAVPPRRVRRLPAIAAGNGVILLDQERRISDIDEVADAILLRGDALVASGPFLRAVSRTFDETLQGLIREGRLGTGGSLILPRQGGGRDYLVAIAPLRGGDFLPRARIRILVVDPDAVVEFDPRWLRRLFGLTGAEANLALRLFAGANLEEAAREAGVARSTARVHLVHIFRKTRTSRQAELVRLLMSYPWYLLAEMTTSSA